MRLVDGEVCEGESLWGRCFWLGALLLPMHINIAPLLSSLLSQMTICLWTFGPKGVYVGVGFVKLPGDETHWK